MRVLLYNVQLASSLYMHNGQRERTAEIIAAIKDRQFDALVFLEAFHRSCRDQLVRALSADFPHHAHLPRHALAFVCGGVLVLSKWPLKDTEFFHYRNAASVERLASKGALWVRLDTPRGPWNLVATHVQAWDEHRATRVLQFEQLHAWVRERVPTSEPLMVLGDLNFDYHTQIHHLRAIIGPDAQVVRLTGAMQFASSAQNNMRGLDGSAEEGGCAMDYYCRVCWSTDDPGLCRMVCEKPAVKKPVKCECCKDLLVDYAFIPRGYPRATRFSLSVEEWKASRPLRFAMWKSGWITRPDTVTRDLSDHYPCVIETS